MKFIDLNQMDDAALKSKIVDLSKENMNLRFQKVSGQLEKTHQFKIARRTVARIKTILSQRAKKA